MSGGGVSISFRVLSCSSESSVTVRICSANRSRSHSSLHSRAVRMAVGCNLLLILGFGFRVGPLVLGNIMHNVAVPDAHEAKQPKQVERLQKGEQRKCDDVGDPAFVLLRLPVELVGTDGPKLAQQ